jgi:SAM-dependent methyltransferase
MEFVTCNLCGHDDWFVRYPSTVADRERPEVVAYRCTHSGYGSHPQIAQCRNCGLVYANPRWDPEDLLDAYSAVEDDRYVIERAGRVQTFTKHLQALEKWAGPGEGRNLLDLGAYIGVFVEVAISHGWEAIGIEPSRWAVEVARGNGLPIVEGTLAAEELIGRRFDVITMWDVIEHLDDPSYELRKIYNLLEPGGLLAVHTMDIDSFIAKLMGTRWPWLMDMHIHYFSRKTLREMLHKTGFQVLWVGAQGRYLSLGYIVSRLRGLSKPLGRIVGWPIARTGASETTVPLNFGDLMTVYARKVE